MGSTTDNQKRKDLRKQLFSGESKHTPGKELDEQESLVPNWEVDEQECNAVRQHREQQAKVPATIAL